MRMVHTAQEKHILTGLIEHIIPNGVAILQYVDDTIIFLKHSIEGARNSKMLLYLYEMMAGLKINFNKSEVVMINDDNIGERFMLIFSIAKLVSSQ